jgi:hypothetical protein
MREPADRKYEWTDEKLTLAARSHIATGVLREQAMNDLGEARQGEDTTVELVGLEALSWVLDGTSTKALDEKIEQTKASLAKKVVGHVVEREGTVSQSKNETKRRRYANDPEYRASVIEKSRQRRKSPEYRERERERSRRRRAKS